MRFLFSSLFFTISFCIEAVMHPVRGVCSEHDATEGGLVNKRDLVS